MQGKCTMLAQGDSQAGADPWGWAEHANKMVHPPQQMYRWPANGPNNDNAHPPIHPTQYVSKQQIGDNLERRLYEFICRSFLACAPATPASVCSLPALHLGTVQ